MYSLDKLVHELFLLIIHRIEGCWRMSLQCFTWCWSPL